MNVVGVVNLGYSFNEEVDRFKSDKWAGSVDIGLNHMREVGGDEFSFLVIIYSMHHKHSIYFL